VSTSKLVLDVETKKGWCNYLLTTTKLNLLENVKVRLVDVKDFYVDNVFFDDIKVKQFKSTLELPESYILAYSFEEIYHDLKFLTSIYFQEEGENILDGEVLFKKNDNLQFELNDFNLANKVSIVEDSKSIHYKFSGLKSYLSHANSVGYSYFLPHVVVSIKSVTKDGVNKNYLSSVDDLYHWYIGLIKELKPDRSTLDEVIKSLQLGNMATEKKIEKIFNWVRDNVQYVAFENGIAGFKPVESSTVAKTKYGDCKGIANLLVNLLLIEDIEAHYAWIGTRVKNYNYSVPSLVVDNHMICCVIINGQNYFLDATGSANSWNKTPPYIEGKEVLIETGDDYKVELVNKTSPQDNQLLILGNLEILNSKMRASLEITLNGHFYDRYWSDVKQSPKKDKLTSHIEVVKDYLKWMDIESYSAPERHGNELKFNLEGPVIDAAFSDSKVVFFPFFNLIPYDYLTELSPPIYFDFPSNVELELSFSNKGNLGAFEQNYHQSDNDLIGDFDFKIEREDDNELKFIQSLNIVALNSPLGSNQQWNAFLGSYLRNTIKPIVYDFH